MKLLARIGLGTLVAGLLALLVVVAPRGTIPAYAAGDQIDSYALDYVVQTDGTVDVTETLVYRFGDSSGRHGIERSLLTREPELNDTTTDIAYEYTDIQVTSPDAPDQFTTSTQAGPSRTEYLRIRVGDPDVTISAPTATYELRYTIHGGLRSQDAYDEFYWDATGFEWPNTTLNNVSVSVTVPEGATDGACFVGPPQSTRNCDSLTVTDGVVRAEQATIQPGEGLTIGAQIRSGLVSNNTPQLVPSQQVQQQRRLAAVGAATGATTVASAVGGVLLVRSRRDRRYVDLPPGVIPPRGQEGRIGPSTRDIEVPVSFTPPPITVAEAGLLMDGQLEPRETAATIIDLAVHGVLKVSGDQSTDYQLTLVDPYAVRANHEAVLVRSLFPSLEPGSVVSLGTAGQMTAAHDAMSAALRAEIAQHGWFTTVPEGASTRQRSGFSPGALVFFALIAVSMGSGIMTSLLFVLPVVPIIIAALVVRNRLKRGQRTALGRALTDQGEGFRQYLATAEADQIRFEEGEDIFSKYLPWAISFGLADRWARICQQLVDAGRLPDIQPDWYAGHFYLHAFSWTAFSNAVSTTVGPPPADFSGSGTGFGSGGSAFGGGGFSGGGGGGGGGGSW